MTDTMGLERASTDKDKGGKEEREDEEEKEADAGDKEATTARVTGIATGKAPLPLASRT